MLLPFLNIIFHKGGYIHTAATQQVLSYFIQGRLWTCARRNAAACSRAVHSTQWITGLAITFLFSFPPPQTSKDFASAPAPFHRTLQWLLNHKGVLPSLVNANTPGPEAAAVLTSWPYQLHQTPSWPAGTAPPTCSWLCRPCMRAFLQQKVQM